MIQHQLALIQRELWEHRAIFVTPLVIGLVLAVGVLVTEGMMAAHTAEVDLGIAAASNIAEESHRSAVVNGFLVVPSVIIFIGMSVTVIFYSLDSLYAERKDKSILFWRSLPITDAETVISKLLTSGLVIPLVSFVVIVLTQLVSMILTSIWIMIEGGNAVHLVWAPASLTSLWAATLAALLSLSLWFAPFLGWLLFVSAFAKRMPLLLAALPIILLPMFENWIFGTHLLFNAFFVRTIEPLRDAIEAAREHFEISDNLRISAFIADPWQALDFAAIFMKPNLWAGLLVCAIFVTAAIYVRRYRDES
jgi:ABC-2 type transport system permease protein